jgi:hypothetical protein
MAWVLVSALPLVVACDSDSGGGAGGGGTTTSSQGGASSSSGGGSTTGSGGGAATTTTTTTTTTGTGGGSGVPTAAELLAAASACNVISSSGYKTDDEAGLPANIDVCGLTGAVFWKADMDIDCDGKETTQCNASTDPSFYAGTAASDSNGDPLDAAALPYVVIPSKSTRFDYAAAGIKLGAVVAVIYQGQVQYGVFGDTGPSNIIGEASYAMAASLGIDPDPATGGADSGVTYIVFTGAGAVVAPIEDHAAAVALGQSLAAQLVAN